MFRRLLMLAFWVFFNLTSSAQYDHVWAFGNLAGLDFSTNPPGPIKTALNTSEGSASICNENGELLFYTDGTSVWDRNNQLMPNGQDMPGVGLNITASTSQGALIVPMPGTTDKYYLFSLGNIVAFVSESPYYGKLYYSIVDMNLNNGRGDIVPGKKGILLDTFFMEQMTAVSGNHCNIWLMATSRDSTIKAYNIDINGIAASPVISARVAGERYAKDHLGTMILSPDRSKLGLSKGNLVLYDFDAETGRVSNPVILDSEFYDSYYGTAFSPDNTKLYATCASGLLQYEVTGLDSAAIVRSKMKIVPPGSVRWAMRLGPDGKIYMVANGNFLAIINQPNLKGAASDFVSDGLLLKEGTSSTLGITNMITIVTNRKVVRVQADTAFCTQTHLLTPLSPSGMNYVWDNGSKNATRVVDQPGVYWVSYQVNSPCMFDENTDTFRVIFDTSRKQMLTTIPAQGLCPADTVLLAAVDQQGTDYIWADGGNGSQRIIDRPGTYVLSYFIDSLCQDREDRFVVTYADPKVSFTADTIICQNEKLQLINSSDTLFHHFEWSFGDQGLSTEKNPEHFYPLPGVYRLKLKGIIDALCQDTVYKDIIVDSFLLNRFLMDRDSICTGESIRFRPQLNSLTISSLSWDFGNGPVVSLEQELIQHAFDSSGILPIALNTQFRACPSSLFTDTVQVFALPKVDLGRDTVICNKSVPIVLANHGVNDPGKYQLTWSTGDTTVSIAVLQEGNYTLTVAKDPLGCSTTESIKIDKNCFMDIPNAFTPNGDGFNDYFFSPKYLGKSVETFDMQVFDRWGQMVYATRSLEERGWDGRFNGKEQPQGTYLYRIHTSINGRSEHYQGNVTIIR